MKVLKKYSTGGNVQGGESNITNGSITFDPIDLSNDLKGTHGKNIISDSDGFNQLVMLNQPWVVKDKQLSRILEQMYYNGKPLFGDWSKLGYGKLTIAGVKTSRNQETGAVIVESLIIKTSNVGYGKTSAYHMEIENKQDGSIGIYNFKIDENGLGARVSGDYARSRNTTYGHAGGTKVSEFRKGWLWSRLQNTYTNSVKQHYWHADIRRNFDIQKINATNPLFPENNNKRNISHQRSLTSWKYMKEVFLPNWNNRKYKNWPTYRNLSLDRYIASALRDKGMNGLLYGAYNSETQTWDKDIVKKAGIIITNVGGEKYLTITTKTVNPERESWVNYDAWKGEVINIKLDKDDGMSMKVLELVENFLIKNSPIGNDELNRTYTEGGGNYSNKH